MARNHAETARPTIELYLYSLNQEFPKDKGHGTFVKRMSELKPSLSGALQEIDQVESQVFRLPANDWSVQWISNEWIENHVKAAGMGEWDLRDPIERVMVREEDFGAILFEPTSDRVFKLNRPGAQLFAEIRDAYRSGARDLDRFSTPNFAPEDVAQFVAYLEGAGLWMRA